MTEFSTPENSRSYGCTLGCGNPYDVIVILVTDGETMFLCMPCYVRVASDVLEAFLDAANPKIQDAIRRANDTIRSQTPGPSGKSRGRNAPADNTDPDITSMFDSVISVEELPDEFK